MGSKEYAATIKLKYVKLAATTRGRRLIEEMRYLLSVSTFFLHFFKHNFYWCCSTCVVQCTCDSLLPVACKCTGIMTGVESIVQSF